MDITMNKVIMGQMPKAFQDGTYQDITFSVTEDCNLRCKYCYMFHKTSFKKMSFETAKRAIDLILQDEPKYEYVVWNFIGGEPTLEMDLIDKITDYIRITLFRLDHPWKYKHMFSIGTNGLLYKSNKVQDYLKKNENFVDVSITIDGNKEKHDMSRIRKDGSGSFDEVKENVLLWLEQTKNQKQTNTKATFSSDDLPFLSESIISLWDIGIDYVMANVVYEDVWKEKDPEIFYEQLIKLADKICEQDLWDKKSVRFFDSNIGYPMSESDRKAKFCGTGNMIAISADGRFYPCIRFLDFCMSNGSAGFEVGDIDCGIDQIKSSVFEGLTIERISPIKCKECNISLGCFSCAGNSYNDTNCLSVYHRATYNCEMFKMQVKANKYLWTKYSKQKNAISPLELSKFGAFTNNNWRLDGLTYLYIITSDDVLPFCNYSSHGRDRLDEYTLQRAIDYAYEKNMVPVWVSNEPSYLSGLTDYFTNIKIFPIESNYEKKSVIEFLIPIYQCGISDLKNNIESTSIVILNVDNNNIEKLHFYCKSLLSHYKRVNINKVNLLSWNKNDCISYETQVSKLTEDGLLSKTNLYADKIRLNCKAGDNSFALCPDGNIYACPAFYYLHNNSAICSLEDDITKKDNIDYYKPSKSVECSDCEHYQCKYCLYHNYLNSGDVTVPGEISCRIAGIENKAKKQMINT